MKAYEIQAFGFENLKLVEHPDPEPTAGEVLLKMRAWSLNFRDLMVAKGHYNPRLKMPAVPLSDGVGEVVKIGEGVSRVKVGDRVAGCFMPKWIAGEIDETKARSALGGGGPTGMLAEYVAISEEGVVHVPEHLSDEQAAAPPCAAVTAWHALVPEGHVKSGDTVLVQGTGGVSMFALQFAAMHGARVIATSSSDEKLAKALTLGASDGINYKSTPEWDKRTLELTGSRGGFRRRGRRRRHATAVDEGRSPRRSNQPDRRAFGRRTGQSDAYLDERHPRTRHLRRLARHVRSHEPRDCPAQDAANRRPRISLRRSGGSIPLHGKRGSLRESRNQDRLIARANENNQGERVESSFAPSFAVPEGLLCLPRLRFAGLLFPAFAFGRFGRRALALGGGSGNDLRAG